MGNIYLVGFMATGKSSVGKQIAAKKKLRFVDLDELIELREKAVIADIFAKKGEPYFRKAEKRALKEVSAQDNFVVACGGGIVTDRENIKLMKQTGTIICLKATVGEIIKRSRAFRHRPLLNVAEPRKQIETLLKLRAPYYALADISVDTAGIPLQEVVKKILKLIPSGRRVQ